MAKYDALGQEIPDDTPVEVPLRLKAQPGELERLREMMSILSNQASQDGAESFEEANDFDVEDDVMPFSPHEILDDGLFHSAEQELLDRAARDMHNERAASSQHKGESDVHDAGTEGDRSGAGGAGEVGAASGGKGRAAGNGGRGVSEGGRRDSGGAEEGGASD